MALPGAGTVFLSLAASAAASALAQRAPGAARLLAPPARDASLLLGCVFLASVGASARLAQLVSAGPAAVAFAATVLAAHCVLLFALALAANQLGATISAPQLIVASNANVGGAGTAVAMANALGWTQLVAPAATCGVRSSCTAPLLSHARRHDLCCTHARTRTRTRTRTRARTHT